MQSFQSCGLRSPFLSVPSVLSQILARFKGDEGAARDTGAGSVRRPSQSSAHRPFRPRSRAYSLGSFKFRTPSVSGATPQRKTGALGSGEEQSCPETPGSTRQVDHTLSNAASSDPESSRFRWAGRGGGQVGGEEARGGSQTSLSPPHGRF